MKRLRAIEFRIQPFLVLDDGEHLEGVRAEPIVVTAADWPTYATEKWPEALAQTEAQLNGDEAASEK